MNEPQVILVDENDRETGIMNKLEAHQKGVLHRAFSVFIFNSKNELLLQKRAISKYHSGGLWTNSCCSHPVKDEPINSTIQNRLHEEIGMRCHVVFQFTFTYKADVGSNLTEHELDHVYFGISDETPRINSEEVAEWKYISKNELKSALQESPERFTRWLNICFDEIDKRWPEE